MNDRTNERIFYSIIMYPYYKSKINKQYRKIFDAYSYEECITEMEKVYRMIKKSSALYYNGSNMNCLYDGLKARIIRCEDLLEGTPIIDSDPYFVYNNEYFEKTKFIDLKNTQEKLNYIVWCARKNIVDRYRIFYDRDVNLEDFFLVDECLTVSVFIELLCDKLGISCKTVKIPPAYTDEIKLYDGDGFHYFNIIKIDGNVFLVDCTYRQFFRLDDNLLERMGVLGLNGCNVGAYMILNNERKKVADNILKNGWVHASPQNVKSYLDGFTLSFRNGLYYENVGNTNYDVPYTLNDYRNFFDGKDNQINHESWHCLGVQEEPLEDYKLNFKV